MEFSECRKQQYCSRYLLGVTLFFLFPVDAAFGERDPLRRIAFVAAFAMSNYSSTIGRIAKPFNPMLVSICSSRSSFPLSLRLAERDV
jgi:hypothetical protein